MTNKTQAAKPSEDGRSSRLGYSEGRCIIVSLQDVSRIYHMGEEEVRALQGVTLDVYVGEYLSIMGPSGSGKSTLFNMIGGLDKPTTGDVLVHGVHLSRLGCTQTCVCLLFLVWAA